RFELLRRHARAVRSRSVDDAVPDVGETSAEDAARVARAIKQEVRAATALSISIGVASGKMVAKIACDAGKPDGLVVVPPGTERAYLAPKPVGLLWGIGPKTQARLREHGIETVEQIAAMEADALRELFGRWGAELQLLARGVD